MLYRVRNRDGADVRCGPGTAYERVGRLKYGTRVEIDEQKNGWGMIEGGYVYMYFVETVL